MLLNKNRDNSKGVVLVLVLVIFMALSGLTLMTIEVSTRGAVEASRMRSEYDAHFIAEEILYLVFEKIRNDNTPFSDTPMEEWAGLWEDDNVSYVVRPCNSKINLNKLADLNDNAKVLSIMRSLLPGGADVPRLLGSLGGWVGKSDSAVLEKMDMLYYASQFPSYAPPHNYLQAPEEILLVSGWKDLDRQWVDATFTVWGDENVNINFASKEILLAYFPELGRKISSILHWRNTRGFTDLSQVLTVAGIEADSDIYREMLSLLTVRSSYFEVIVTAEVTGCRVVKRYIIARPETFQTQLSKLIFQSDISVTFPES
ncbi:type II secretion system minor pseudopilin [Maridesulfovibrio frigidus]|uniref:general secretion pathway protein GspK n=1 Tax=Maridesulfovibrio frigidus TaxID=340956 RepID=UPI0004E1C85D|nr:type II secretion system protein GspK [Maridesulfovibrio frigidus]